MSNIKNIQTEIINEFSMFEDWEDLYAKMIDLAKNLPSMDDKFKTDKNSIKGCQSNVWLHAIFKDNKIYFTGDSDTLIIKGVIAILIRTFSNQTPENIANSDAFFFNKIGLKEHLSPTRANGILSMIKQFKTYANSYRP